MHAFCGGLCWSPVLRRAAVTLVAMAWGSFAYCGEIHDAAPNGDLEKVKALLKDKPDLVYGKDENYGATPLHLASMEGHRDVAELLLSSKAEVNAKDNNGWTPLHWAAAGGHLDVAELLLAGKAEVNAKDKYGQTPLHLAAGMGHKATAELLLTNRAEVNAKNDAGRTPLHEAAVFDQKDVVKMLRQQRGRE